MPGWRPRWPLKWTGESPSRRREHRGALTHRAEHGVPIAEETNGVAQTLDCEISGLEPAVEPQRGLAPVDELPRMDEHHRRIGEPAEDGVAQGGGPAERRRGDRYRNAQHAVDHADARAERLVAPFGGIHRVAKRMQRRERCRR